MRARTGRVIIAVLWPSFVVAGIVTAVLFAHFDPRMLPLGVELGLESRLAAYTVGFLLLWLISAASAAAACASLLAWSDRH